MKLSAPSFWIFMLSTAMIALIIGGRYFGLEVPVITALARGHPFEAALTAWLLLFIGILFNL